MLLCIVTEQKFIQQDDKTRVKLIQGVIEAKRFTYFEEILLKYLLITSFLPEKNA